MTVDNPMNLASYSRINTPACYPQIRINTPAFSGIYALTLPPLRINTPAYVPSGQWWQGFQASSCIHLYLKNLYLGVKPVSAAIINWITKNGKINSTLNDDNNFPISIYQPC
jgi:hypothetical protein